MDDATQLSHFLKSQAEGWIISNGDLESSRLENSLGRVSILPEMLSDIQHIMAMYAGKASQLITNSSTNLAECWMSI